MKIELTKEELLNTSGGAWKLGIIGAILIFIAVWVFLYVYVPNGQEWDLKYNNLKIENIEGRTKSEKAEFTNNGLFTRCNFSSYGDSITYTFDIINDGTIDAKLKLDPIQLKLDYYLKGHIKYILLYSDGSEVKKGDIIKAGESKSFRVNITYNQGDTGATMDSQFYESNLYLMFLQKRF